MQTQLYRGNMALWPDGVYVLRDRKQHMWQLHKHNDYVQWFNVLTLEMDYPVPFWHAQYPYERVV